LNFRQQIAKYVSGNVTTDQLPDIAVQGLEEGLDTPSLCILAGLSKNESPFQIELYFKLTLDELKIELPDRRQAAIEYSMAIVDEILNGEKDIIKGTTELHHNAIESFDFFAESNQYCYDSIGYDTVYGLFDTIDELTNEDRPLRGDKSNEHFMVETKAQLFEELKKWKDKMENSA